MSCRTACQRRTVSHGQTDMAQSVEACLLALSRPMVGIKTGAAKGLPSLAVNLRQIGVGDTAAEKWARLCSTGSP